MYHREKKDWTYPPAPAQAAKTRGPRFLCRLRGSPVVSGVVVAAPDQGSALRLAHRHACDRARAFGLPLPVAADWIVRMIEQGEVEANPHAFHFLEA